MTMPAPRRGGPPRLAVHVALVAVVLGLGLLIARPLVSVSADEGAAIIQAEHLMRTGDWTFANEIPEIDPDGDFIAPPRGEDGDKGHAAYVKHPLYPLALLASRYLSGGTIGYYLLSLVGVVAAAWCAGALAERIREGTSAAALWLTAIGTPLVFYSQIPLAHAAAAGTFAVAALLVVRVAEGSMSSAWLAVAALAAAMTIGLRTEGAIAVVALALGIAVGFGRRAARRAVVIAGVLVAVTFLTRAGEAAVARLLLGLDSPASLPTGNSSFVADRVESLRATWLRASYAQDPLGDAFIHAGAVAAVVGALYARIRREPAALVVGLAIAAACYVGRAVSTSPDLVPGLLVAFPLALAGGVLVRRADLLGTVGATCAVTTAVAVAGVVATQYWFGGGVEWGGRFFAVALPVATPLIAVGLARAAAAMPTPVPVAAAAAAVALSLGWNALAEIAQIRDNTARVRTALDAAGDLAARRTDRDPLVVSTMYLYPRIAWDRYDDYRWLAIEPRSLDDQVARLRAADLDVFVLVSPNIAHDAEVLAPAFDQVDVRQATRRVSVAVYVPGRNGNAR